MQLFGGGGQPSLLRTSSVLLYQMPLGGAAAPSTRLEVASNSAGIIYSDGAMIL